MQHRVLMIDDSQFEADILTYALSKVSDRIILTLEKDAEVALNLVASGQTADLLLLDLHMPMTDGFAFMQEVRRRGIRTPPIIVLTSSNDNDDKVRSLDAGAAKFVTKPDSVDAYRGLALCILDYLEGQGKG